MRVSNLTIQKTLLSDLHSNLSRLLEMQSQMATGKKHSRPSDAPADVAREMSLETSLVENVQYTRNLDFAQAWLANTDTAFDQMTSVVQRVRELTIYAGDGALDDAEVDAIATEIAELQEELRNIANYSVEGRYLLGGKKVCQAPFYRDASGKVCYRGGDEHMEFEIDKGVVGQVSFTGREVFPEAYTRYTLGSVELPLDFEWTGRDEILQIRVGDRAVKVHIPETWKDDNLDGNIEGTDFNRFRDPAESQGLSIDDIAKLIRDSMSMGDVSRIVDVSVVKDAGRGVQRLVFTSRTGEPIQVTGWPETDRADMKQGIVAKDVLAGWTSAADETITIQFDGGDPVTVAIPSGSTLQHVADTLSGIQGIHARVNTEGAGERLVISASTEGKKFTLTRSAGLTDLFTEENTASTPVKRAVDHSHIDLASFLGMETTVKSVQMPTSGAVLTPGATNELQWRLQSGDHVVDLKISDITGLTADDLANRIKQVAGDWLEVTVETDETETTAWEPGVNHEDATKRLLLRPKDNAPLVIYDRNQNTYASQLGMSTAIRCNGSGVGDVVFPTLPCVDPNVPSLMKIEVGEQEFEVKLYLDDVRNAGGTVDRAKVMAQIVKQVNEQAGEKLLASDVVNVATGETVLVAKTGEALRITDLPVPDPALSPSYSGGVALQMGIAAGVSSTRGAIQDTDTINTLGGTAGTIRIRSAGKTVDVDLASTDTMKDVADKIRAAAGSWLDITFFDGDLTTPGSDVLMSVSAKDGSAVSLYDVTGNSSQVLTIDTALRGANAAVWSPSAGGGDQIVISVEGYSHTIDIDGCTSVEDVAKAINARFQGGDVQAEVVQDGAEKHLVLWSPKGNVVTMQETRAAAGSGAFFAGGSGGPVDSPSRGGTTGSPFNQNVVTRSAASREKTDFFGLLDDLAGAVRAEDRKGLSDSMLAKVDDFLDNLLKRRTQEGAFLKRYQSDESRMKQNNTSITELYSKVGDVDLADAATQFAMAQSVYQASLAVIAKIVQPTLVDFLR